MEPPPVDANDERTNHRRAGLGEESSQGRVGCYAERNEASLWRYRVRKEFYFPQFTIANEHLVTVFGPFPLLLE